MNANAIFQWKMFRPTGTTHRRWPLSLPLTDEGKTFDGDARSRRKRGLAHGGNGNAPGFGAQGGCGNLSMMRG